MGAVQYFGNGECPRSSRRRSRTRGHVGTRVRGGFPANPTVRRFGIFSGGPISPACACDRGTIPGRLTDVDIPSPIPSQPLRFTWALRLPSAWASASSRAPCGRYVDPPTHRPARPAHCSDDENIRDFPLTSLPSLSFATTELALADTLQVGGVLREHQDEVSVGRTCGREGRPMCAVAPKLVDL